MEYMTIIKVSKLLKEYWKYLQRHSIDSLSTNLIDKKYKGTLSKNELMVKYKEARDIFDSTLTGTFENGSTIRISYQDARPYGNQIAYCLKVNDGKSSYTQGGMAFGILDDGLVLEVDGGDVYKVQLITE